MESICEGCGELREPDDNWHLHCVCGDLLLCPIGPGMKYCGAENGVFNRVPENEVMIEYEGVFYAVDDNVVEIRCGQEVFGAFRVEGIVKERLEELIYVREELEDMEESLVTKEAAGDGETLQEEGAEEHGGNAQVLRSRFGCRLQAQRCRCLNVGHQCLAGEAK